MAEVAFSSVDKKSVDGERPVALCNYTDVFYNRLILPDMDLMKATGTSAECEKWTLKAGDVFFTKDSETRDEIGIPAYVPEDMPNVLCGYHLGRARPDHREVNGSFLARALGSHASAREFARIANGITRFGLTLDATRSLPLLLPPLEEQRAIAAVLDSIDEAIERTEGVIAVTERLRDALLHDLLTRGLPGRHTEWKQVRGLGTIPASWDVVRLGDISERITKGTTPTTLGHSYAQEGVRFLRVENVNGGLISGGEMKFISEDTHQFLGRSILQQNDILLSIAGALGRTALVHEENLPANVNQALSIVRLRSDAPADPRFIALCLEGGSVQTQIEDMRTELAQANLNLQQVGGLLVSLPLLDEQYRIASAIDSIDQTMARNGQNRDTLEAVKASTADALLTGRLNAPQRKE